MALDTLLLSLNGPPLDASTIETAFVQFSASSPTSYDIEVFAQEVDALGNPVLMALNSDDGIDLLGSEAAIAVAIISFAGIIFISLAGFLFYQKTKKTDTLI